MSFRFLGVTFRISVPFAVMLAFLLVTDATGLMSASLLAVIAHEAGHLIAMKATGCAPASVTCGIGGVLMTGNSFSTARESVIIALSGPFVNLLLTALFWALGSALDVYLLLAFSAVQFLVGAVNLLPVKGLDGGTVLRVLLFKKFERNAGLACSLVSILTACAITVAGLAVAVKNVSNPSLLLLGIYLIMINISKFNN